MKKQYIDKSEVVAEIERKIKEVSQIEKAIYGIGLRDAYKTILSFLNTLEVKEEDLTDRKTDWRPSNKQIESLHDMLKYNIGVFEYQKFMEVNSLYDDLAKILDYGKVH